MSDSQIESTLLRILYTSQEGTRVVAWIVAGIWLVKSNRYTYLVSKAGCALKVAK
jgi:hypothetical protein